MVVLVTGATGFVGRHVVQALLARGKDVRCLVHSPGREKALGSSKVDVRFGSVTDPAALEAAFYDVNEVVHLVAVIRERGQVTYDKINRQGTANVAAAAAQAGVQRFVHMSAIGARNDPSFRYLYSKWQGEQAVIKGGVPYTILRASLLFGEGDQVANSLAGLVRVFPIVPVAGDGKAQFQPLSVEDLARCVVATVDNQALVGRMVEIGGPEQLTYDQMLDVVCLTLGVRRLKLHIPMPLMRGIVRAMGALLPRPPATTEELKMLSVPNVAQPNAVEETFGFSPRPLGGNIGYVKRVGFWDGLKISLGAMPPHIRDH